MTASSDYHRLVVSALSSEGAGPPVVLIHGFGCSIDTWPTELIRSIGRHHRCIAISLPGHFPATCECDDYERSIQAAAVTQALAHAVASIGEKRVILIGHSAGGWLALRLAATFPDRVLGVVAISAFASGRLQGIFGKLQSLACRGPVLQWIARSLVWTAARQALAFGIVHRHMTYYRYGQISEAPTQRFLQTGRQAAKLHNPRSLIMWLKMLQQDDSKPLIKNIRAPVLLIHGGRDRVVSLMSARSIAAQLRSPCEFVALPDAGHFPFLEAFDRLENHLNAWLDELCPSVLQ